MTASTYCHFCGWTAHILNWLHSYKLEHFCKMLHQYKFWLILTVHLHQIYNHHSTLYIKHVYCILKPWNYNLSPKFCVLSGSESPDLTAGPALLVAGGPVLQPLQCPEISSPRSRGCVYHLGSCHLPAYLDLQMTQIKWLFWCQKHNYTFSSWHGTWANSNMSLKKESKVWFLHEYTLTKCIL